MKGLRQIDYMCEIGERVQWSNTKGEKFEGIILKWNNFVATVRCSDGTTVEIEC